MDIDDSHRERIRAFAQWCGEGITKCYKLSDIRCDAWNYSFTSDNECYAETIDPMLFYCMYAFEEGSGEVLGYDEMVREIALFEDGLTRTGLVYASPDFLDAGYRRFDVRTMHDDVYRHCFYTDWISQHTGDLELLFAGMSADEATKNVRGLQRRRLFSKRSCIAFGFKWHVQELVHLVIAEDVTLARIKDILWAMTDGRNTFSELNRCECGLNLDKHGDERQGKDYHEIFLRFAENFSYKRIHYASCTCSSCQPNGGSRIIVDRERTVVLKKGTSMYLLFEQLGGTSLTANELVDIQARFVFSLVPNLKTLRQTSPSP